MLSRGHFRTSLKAVTLGLALLASNLAAQKVAIVVLDFDSYGVSEPEVITLTNRLRNELFRLGTFRVVERGMMQSILAEQDFQLSGCSSDECLVEIGRLVGAEQAVGGSIGKVGNVFSISARIVDVASGELLNVADYDLSGQLSDALTIGMPAIARLLATMPPSEETPTTTSESLAVAPIQTGGPSGPATPGTGLMPNAFVGLDLNMALTVGVKQIPGKGPKLSGISLGLGIAIKQYHKPLVAGRFNVYHAYGTDALILPFVSYGSDYILKNGSAYLGATITSRLINGFIPFPLVSGGLIF